MLGDICTVKAVDTVCTDHSILEGFNALNQSLGSSQGSAMCIRLSVLHNITLETEHSYLRHMLRDYEILEEVHARVTVFFAVRMEVKVIVIDFISSE